MVPTELTVSATMGNRKRKQVTTLAGWAACRPSKGCPLTRHRLPAAEQWRGVALSATREHTHRSVNSHTYPCHNTHHTKMSYSTNGHDFKRNVTPFYIQKRHLHSEQFRINMSTSTALTLICLCSGMFSPGHSQQNVQCVWSTPPTEIRMCTVCMGYTFSTSPSLLWSTCDNCHATSCTNFPVHPRDQT
jgi:hypothetical protein